MAKGAVKTAAEAASNWSAAMGSSTTQAKYKQGISKYTGNPMAEAAKQESLDLYKSNTAAAVDSGRMAAALQAADQNSWRNNALQYGAANLANGAKKGAAKYQKKADKLASVWAQQRAAVSGMAKGGEANAIARVQTAIHLMMAAFGKV